MKTIVMIITLLLVASIVGCAIVPLAPAPYYGYGPYYGPHVYEPYGYYGPGRYYGHGYRY